MPKKKNKKEDDAVLNQLKRLQADFDNYKKRVEKEKENISGNAKIELLKELIPTLDAFEKAMPLIQDEGVKMIYKNLLKTLDKVGLKKIKSEGEKFNINLHDAVMTVTGKEENELIMEEVEPGYTFKSRVVRHSKVIVNKKE